MNDERLATLEEKLAWLQRHVTEQDRAMRELAGEIDRLKRKGAELGERPAPESGIPPVPPVLPALSGSPPLPPEAVSVLAGVLGLGPPASCESAFADPPHPLPARAAALAATRKNRTVWNGRM